MAIAIIHKPGTRGSRPGLLFLQRHWRFIHQCGAVLTVAPLESPIRYTAAAYEFAMLKLMTTPAVQTMIEA